MTDEGQTGLGDFGPGGDDETARPEEEAVYVAGDGAGGAEVVDPTAATLPDAEGTVEMTVTQVDYTIAGMGDDEEPLIHVFGRRADRTAEHVVVRGFQPYFYAPTDTVSEETLASYDAITGYEEGYESIRGEELTKIFGRTPRDVGQMRDDFQHYEADVLFPNRFLIDKDVGGGVAVPNRRLEDGRLLVDHEEVAAADPPEVPPRMNVFDIEVDDRSGFPEDGEEPIVCLASHDSYDDEYVVWLFEAPDGDGAIPDELGDYDPLTDDADYEVRAFDTEEAMLDAFLSYIEETDPGVLSGWNFEDFDAPYLLDRLEVLQSPAHEYDLSIDRLSRVGEVWRSGWGGPDVKGRVVFDLLRAYKRTQFSELESYRLDAVGEVELGVGKERYAGDIGDLWEENPERLLEYNLRDVELCVELDRKQDIVQFWMEVKAFVGCLLEDAPTPGDAVDMYVMHEAHDQFVLPSKGQQEAGEEFEGGAVFEPITGVREMVSVLDLKSLYPMSMATVNASPETRVDPERYDGETYRSPDGTHFRKEPDGMMREMIDALLTERERKKGERNEHDPDSPEYKRYDQQQAAVKRVMNCFTPDTDVLTPDGVVGITDLEAGDEVYSLDPETVEMEVKPVVETQAYPDYGGDLIDVETSKIDLRVTPNHRMLVRKAETNGITWDEDDYRFVEAGDLDDATNYQLPHDWEGPSGDRLDRVDLTELLDDYEVWANNDVHGHTLAAEIGSYPNKVKKNDVDETGYVFSAEQFEAHRDYLDDHCSSFYVHGESNRKWIPRQYDGDDFLELLAWYITEGSVYTSETKEFGEKLRGSATTIQIAQDAVAATDGGVAAVDEATSDHATVGALLDRMGFDYHADDRCYQFTSRLLGEYLERTCGADSFEKRVPEFVFETSREQKRAFLDTLIAGDGDRQTGSWRYTTASERLRDDVLRLCAHLGLTASYTEDGDGTYRLYVSEGSKNTLRMHRSAETSTAEDGVYCVTVADNHTLLAGRNGTFQFVGQSLYGVSGWEQFRLYDKDAAAAITATGRSVIEFTDEVASEMGYQVAYGDTDSVMLELGGEVSAQEAIDSSFAIEEAINDRYDDYAREQLNATTHRFQIEFEKLYRRFFQAGKKKRYAGHIVWKEGKDVDDVDITGFEYQRSDIAGITKEVQHRVIELLVREGDVEGVEEYVHDTIEEFKQGNLPLDEVGIPGGIGKKLDAYETDTAQVRGAKYANVMLGTNFASGSKPMRLYVDSVHPEFWQRMERERGLDPSGQSREDRIYREFKRDPDVICFEYADQVPEEFSVDWDKMLEKTLKGPIARILEALDVSWDEVETGQQQTGLGNFM